MTKLTAALDVVREMLRPHNLTYGNPAPQVALANGRYNVFSTYNIGLLNNGASVSVGLYFNEDGSDVFVDVRVDAFSPEGQNPSDFLDHVQMLQNVARGAQQVEAFLKTATLV